MEDPNVEIWHATAITTTNDNNNENDLRPTMPLWIWQSAVLVPTLVGACLLAPMWMRQGGGAPFAPTTRGKQRVMLQHIARHYNSSNNACRRRILYDLGSGDGRLVLAAARQGQQLGLDACIGIEMNPLLHYTALMRQWWFHLKRHGSNATTTIQFYRQDLWQTSLHDAAVVTLYAYPPMMHDLGQKLRRELPPGALVVSNQYPIPKWQPSCSPNNDDDASQEIVFVYQMPPTLVTGDDDDDSLVVRQEHKVAK